MNPLKARWRQPPPVPVRPPPRERQLIPRASKKSGSPFTDRPTWLMLCLSLRGSGVLVLVTRVGGGRAGVCDFGAAVGLAFGDRGGGFFRQLGAGGLGRFGLLLGFFLLD